MSNLDAIPAGEVLPRGLLRHPERVGDGIPRDVLLTCSTHRCHQAQVELSFLTGQLFELRHNRSGLGAPSLTIRATASPAVRARDTTDFSRRGLCGHHRQVILTKGCSELSCVAVEQHRIAEREKSVVLFNGMLIEPPPAFADERIDHQEQRGTRHMEVGHQQIDVAEAKPARDEQVGATRGLARCTNRFDGTRGGGADGDHTFRRLNDSECLGRHVI